jgi:hypothetical protein
MQQFMLTKVRKWVKVEVITELTFLETPYKHERIVFQAPPEF